MTLVELKQLLDATGLPVAYSHFKKPESPPFIAYREVDSENFKADNRVFHKVRNVDIELYTSRKDPSIEIILEQLLDANDIPYDTTEIYIDDEKLFLKTYEVRLI